MPDTDTLSKSVTKHDYQTQAHSGVMQFFISSYGGLGAMPSLPPFWSHERDLVLSATIYREPVWASAVWKFCSRQVARQWEIKSDVSLRAKKAQELFLDFDEGRGWAAGMFKHLQAYRLTGNGGWIEIIRATAARGSKIIGLNPLDPLRCTRTGNPSEPMFYRDMLGNLHWLKDYQVFNINDMPDNGAMFYNLGHCAAERAYNKILQMEGLERFFLEKLTGRRPTAIHIVNGLQLNQIQQAYRTAEEDAQRKGLQSYLGVAIATVVDPSATLSLVTIPITEVPDGFDPVQERIEAKKVYANNVGIPVQELDPTITAPRALSSAQDLELQETAEGQNVWEKDWIHAVNKYVLDDRTAWYFPDLNLRDELLRAQVTGARTTAYSDMKNAGFITSQQGAQLLVDENEIPEEFLVAPDVTAEETIGDEEKPDVAPDVESNQPAEIVPAQDLPNDPEDEDEIQVKKNLVLGIKSIARYGENFEVDLSNLVVGVFNGRKSEGDLSAGLRGLIKSEAEGVYLEGMVESGEYANQAEAESELTGDDYDAIENWKAEQLSHVKDFAKATAEVSQLPRKEQPEAQKAILARVKLWRNSLEGLGQQGKMAALRNEVGIWELGATEEHCNADDGKYGCAQLNGQAHRMNWYLERELKPGTPGSATKCGGYKCECKIRSKRTGKVIAG